MIAVISDIHANYDALKAVMAQIDHLGAECIICLGDIVGYGPEPEPCIQEVQRRCEVTLCGNHDFALVRGANEFNPVARSSLDYHRSLLMPLGGSDARNRNRAEMWQFLKNLPCRHARGEWLFVHASPRNPIAEYLRKMDVLLGLQKKLLDNFKEVDWLCFVGHTHRAGIITADMKYLEPKAIGDVFRPQRSQKAIINVGSVGQPRDRDWRACFVTIEDDGLVRYHRVEYDVEAVAQKVLAAPGMDRALAERLRQGR